MEYMENLNEDKELEPIEWDFNELDTIKKNFYIEHDNVKSRPQAELDLFIQKQSISIKGVEIPRPIQFFEESQFPKYLKDELERSGFKTPTAIQSQGWPIALSGRDMVGIADTGSGKTLAYLLPGIVHAMAQELVSPGDSPIILVLVPTRELCIQVEKECRKFATICRMSTIAVYGGASRSEQLAHYERGVDIMVATPGRLIDFLSAKDMNLKRVTYLILDEADRMLDMGFEQKIKLICSQIRPDRQTLMFSATWPKEVQSLAQQYCIEKPAEAKIGSNDLTVNKRITQIVQVVEESDKYSSLVKILIKIVPGSKIIIFCGTKLRCNELEQQLIRDHCSPAVLHGDKSQSEREFIIKQFKSKAKNILIATDIASRGLHIDNVMYIINYDFPNQIEDYVHRIGRTGRAGSTGTAYSLFTKKNFMLAPDLALTLASIIKRADQVVPEELQKYVALAQSTKSEHVFRRWNTAHDNSESKQNHKSEELKAEQSSSNELTPKKTEVNHLELIHPVVKETISAQILESVSLNEISKQLISSSNFNSYSF